jgi:hypothetical protein
MKRLLPLAKLRLKAPRNAERILPAEAEIVALDQSIALAAEMETAVQDPERRWLAEGLEIAARDLLLPSIGVEIADLGPSLPR